MLGVLGALDPHKHKMNLGLIQMGEAGTVLSMSDPKASQEAAQDGKLSKYLFRAHCLKIQKFKIGCEITCK